MYYIHACYMRGACNMHAFGTFCMHVTGMLQACNMHACYGHVRNQQGLMHVPCMLCACTLHAPYSYGTCTKHARSMHSTLEWHAHNMKVWNMFRACFVVITVLHTVPVIIIIKFKMSSSFRRDFSSLFFVGHIFFTPEVTFWKNTVLLLLEFSLSLDNNKINICTKNIGISYLKGCLLNVAAPLFH